MGLPGVQAPMLPWLAVLALAEPPSWRADPDPAFATVPAEVDAVVEAALAEAMRYADLPWTWGGRGTERNPGIDCLGLVFRGYGAATGTRWRDYPVDPSKLVASGLLGAPVPGLDGVMRADVDTSLLKRGDVVYFLQKNPIPDAPLTDRDGEAYWPWHVGVYVGEGQDLILNAHPTHDVVRMPLEEVSWEALLVTRPRSLTNGGGGRGREER